jgi:membrane protease YdiL (CAAX protease family)
MLWALLVTLLVGAAAAYGLALPGSIAGLSTQPLGAWLGPWPSWMLLAAPYAALSLLAAYRLAKQHLLSPLLRFRPGDLSIGIGLSILLLGVSWLISRLMLPPDSPARAWLFRIVLLVGDMSRPAALATLVLLCAAEELVWRGFVQAELGARLGPRRGWIVGAVLYAVAHAPTLFTLADPGGAGPNPLVVLAALGAGSCWAFLRERSGRLIPGLFSHLAFSYLATQYLPRFT